MPELYFEKGELYNVLAKPDTAIIYYQKAVSLNPKYTEALYQMATYEIKQRYYYKALVSLQQLQKVKPDYPLINNMIGLCYEKTGDYPRAREYYTVALNMNDADRDAHNGLWRIRVRETNPSYYSGESDERQYKLLDTARVKIDLIQPRKSINMQVDSSRKAKIQ